MKAIAKPENSIDLSFSVDFHPHDYSIVNAISQILLPEVDVKFLEERGEHRGVLAELYKVNVSWMYSPIEKRVLIVAYKIYSGPAGKFQAHVDTPRGLTQFGSLVVCLPHPHEGIVLFDKDIITHTDMFQVASFESPTKVTLPSLTGPTLIAGIFSGQLSTVTASMKFWR
jgi:hypothetical protein